MTLRLDWTQYSGFKRKNPDFESSNFLACALPGTFGDVANPFRRWQGFSGSTVQNLIGRRVLVVGTTGAGKTTLARALAAKLETVHIELDALHWQQNWIPAADFVDQVENELQAESWVIDGNYRSAQARILARADTVIRLDYSLGTKLVRLFRRTSRRTFSREVLWNGNTETFRSQFFSRDSLFV